MVNKKAVLRIYIVLALCWSAWWFYNLNNPNDGLFEFDIMIRVLLPVPIYFGLRWILDAFKDDK